MDRRHALKNTALWAGIGLTGTAISTIFQSCQAENVLDWQPQFFTPSQAPTLSALTEVILPRTGTPGALDLKVPIFVDRMFHLALSPEDQEHVRKGYEIFEKTTGDMFGKDFPDLSLEKQIKVVEKIASQSNRFNPSIWGSTIGKQAPLDFFRRVKQFTLIGFYTSEEIGTKVLVYDPVPGEYKPCIPVQEVGNAWTL